MWGLGLSSNFPLVNQVRDIQRFSDHIHSKARNQIGDTLGCNVLVSMLETIDPVCIDIVGALGVHCLEMDSGMVKGCGTCGLLE